MKYYLHVNGQILALLHDRLLIYYSGGVIAMPLYTSNPRVNGVSNVIEIPEAEAKRRIVAMRLS